MPEQKTSPNGIPLASLTPTQRAFPARPPAGAGRYSGGEDQVDITLVRAERDSKLPAAAPAPTGADALKLFVAGKEDRHPSGIDLLAISPNSKEDQYGFPQQASKAGQTATSAQPPESGIQGPAPGTGAAQELKPGAQAGFFKALRGARVGRDTIQGISLEDLGYAEKVPGSNISEELRMRDGSAHKFSGFEVQLKAQGGSRKFMFSNMAPEILADHGATGYLVTSDCLEAALADGRIIYIIEVCEGASTLKLKSSPREDESAASGQVPLFDNPHEAVRWVARKAASLAEGCVEKEIFLSGSIISLVAAPEDRFFIITNGSVDDATSKVAELYETPEERMLITIDVGNSRSVNVTLQSGESMRVGVLPISMHMSRKRELDLPPSPSTLPAQLQTAPTAPLSEVSPSATGTTETSVRVCLDLGLPQTKEDAAALLKNAIMPTPASVLHGDEGAKADFGRKRRFLTSIADGLRFVAEHNDGDDPLVFTAIRTKVGGQDLSFHLYKLRSSIDKLSPALKDIRQAFVFTDSDSWYILLPTNRISPEVRKLLLESTMAR